MHLAVKGCYLAAEGANQLLLRADILAQQLQFIQRGGLVFLRLLQHLVGLLYLLLQLLLLLLQLLDSICRRGEAQQAKQYVYSDAFHCL